MDTECGESQEGAGAEWKWTKERITGDICKSINKKNLKNNFFIKSLTDIKAAEHFIKVFTSKIKKRGLNNNCPSFFLSHQMEIKYIVEHFSFYDIKDFLFI